MALGDFTISTFDLSSRDLVTGLNNTANVYHVPGIDRPLSIAELVIAICLDRAADIEAKVVAIMEEMSENTKQAEDLLKFENYLVDKFVNGVSEYKDAGGNLFWAQDMPAFFETTDKSKWTLIPEEWWKDLADGRAGAYGAGSWIDYLNKKLGVEISAATYSNALDARGKAGGGYSFTSDDVNSICSAIESRLDALNTLSQEVLIKLQSLTNKRDQTYDLITSMVKSTLTAGQAISGNMR